jgi:hypothetical protein
MAYPYVGRGVRWAEEVRSGAARASEDGGRERQLQCELLRCVFGNPFRSVALEPAWLRWNGEIVCHLARQIHAEEQFADVPILGDALEEAGCTDRDVLDHCRGTGPHVRGCWVVGLVLATI